MNNKTAEHNSGASDSARLFNSYFPSLFKTPPVQRAACALHFEGSLQKSTEIIQLIKYLPTLFNLSHSLEGCDPRFYNPMNFVIPV